MNHLAHIYLSGNDEDLIIGNYIADFVKGKKILDYSDGVQRGIRLHREIDRFTDQHDQVKTSILRVRDNLGKFAGIAIDVYYDHFLALHWQDYHPEKLEDFVPRIYDLLKQNHATLPAHAQGFYRYMITHNILVNYREFDSLRQVFFGLSRRTRFPSNLSHSVDYLEENYEDLYADFQSFFVELKHFVAQQITQGNDGN